MAPAAVRYLAAVAASQAAGLPGALAARPRGDTWYRTLPKPKAQPPAWVFPVVWTALYTLMGLALASAWGRAEPGKRSRLLWPFGLQWALNAAWTPLFFRLKRPDLALADLLALWGASLWAWFALGKASPLARWLWLPYQAWQTFAGALNYQAWRNNQNSRWWRGWLPSA